MKLELLMAVNHSVCAGTQIWVLCQQPVWSHPSNPCGVFMPGPQTVAVPSRRRINWGRDISMAGSPGSGPPKVQLFGLGVWVGFVVCFFIENLENAIHGP